MTDTRPDDLADDAPDSSPAGDPAVDSDPTAPNRKEDGRSDIERAVQARSDAVARGEGGPEPETMTAPGMEDGVGGTGGEVKRDTETQQ